MIYVELALKCNGVAGILATVFAAEITACPGQCAHCATVSLVGTMRAYVRGPGIVLRCPACAEVVIRIAETPRGTVIDVSGATYLRIPPAEV